MSRPAARITHDEVARMVKAVKGTGLPIRKVTYDGSRVEVVIDNGDIGEADAPPLAMDGEDRPLLREPAE